MLESAETQVSSGYTAKIWCQGDETYVKREGTACALGQEHNAAPGSQKEKKKREGNR